MGSLVRSKEDKVLAGVCGGIANFFGISPTLVRVVFVLCGMVLPYIVLAIGLFEE